MTTSIPAQPAVRDRLDDARLLQDLEQVAERELNRHLGVAKEWMPHEYVPWSQGLDFDGPLAGEPWDAAQSQVPPAVRAALVVNLLTEDNLPSYHREIATLFGRDGAWGTWVHRDQTMRAITDAVTGFRMPGHGMPGFDRAAAKIALAGIYNLRIHHDDVLRPVLRHVNALDRADLGPAGRQAQDELGEFPDALEEQAARFEERRAATAARRGAAWSMTRS